MTILETVTFAAVIFCLAVEPLRRFREWRDAGEPIRGLAEFERTRDALREVVER